MHNSFLVNYAKIVISLFKKTSHIFWIVEEKFYTCLYLAKHSKAQRMHLEICTAEK